MSYENMELGRTSLGRVRHFLILLDGTWVSASRKNAIDRKSNVYKLSLYFEARTHASESQVVFYLPGIGSDTSGFPLINGLFANELPLDVEKSYINICTNFAWAEDEQARDKIYIFGFSRGAVVARLLAGLIGRYGLLRPSQIDMFPYIWDDFVGKSNIDDLKHFRHEYGFGQSTIHVEFLGLFDTVYGNYKGKNAAGLKRIFFEDRKLGTHVRAAVHILALDESRSIFRPVLFEGLFEANNTEQVLEQIWMPGVHSDIGGGYSQDFLSKISLLTMLDRVRAHTILNVDFDRTVALKNSIEDDFGENHLAINNDCGEILWKVLRFIRNGKRVLDCEDQCQFIHPIVKTLNGRSVQYKGRRIAQVFKTPEFPFSNYAEIQSLTNLRSALL